MQRQIIERVCRTQGCIPLTFVDVKATTAKQSEGTVTSRMGLIFDRAEWCEVSEAPDPGGQPKKRKLGIDVDLPTLNPDKVGGRSKKAV